MQPLFNVHGLSAAISFSEPAGKRRIYCFFLEIFRCIVSINVINLTSNLIHLFGRDDSLKMVNMRQLFQYIIEQCFFFLLHFSQKSIIQCYINALTENITC